MNKLNKIIIPCFYSKYNILQKNTFNKTKLKLKFCFKSTTNLKHKQKKHICLVNFEIHS